MRYLIALVSATAVAALLFLMMHSWLAAPATPVVQASDPPTVPVSAVPKTPPPVSRGHTRPQPPSIVEPPSGVIPVNYRTEPRQPPETIDPHARPPVNVVNTTAFQPGWSPTGSGGPVRTIAVSPLYPESARRQQQEGWVELAFTVTPAGDVQDVEVLSAKPRGVFERAAVRAVMRWHFRPARHDGRPVSSRVRQVVKFRLDSTASEPGGAI